MLSAYFTDCCWMDIVVDIWADKEANRLETCSSATTETLSLLKPRIRVR